MNDDHDILCLPRQALPSQWLPREGCVPLSWQDFLSQLDATPTLWLPRSQAEEDRRWKQPIPYLLVSAPDGRLAAYRRRGREQRLHGQWSLGIGGHVERLDDTGELGETFLACARRELLEEMGATTDALTFLGLINEERTAVGEVHLGLVFHARITHPVEYSPDLGLIHWLDPNRLCLPLEHWSRLARRLHGKPASPSQTSISETNYRRTPEDTP